MYKIMRNFRLVFLLFSFIFILPTLGQAYGDSDKRALTHTDYDSWKEIAEPEISVDGQWVFYLETPQDGEAELAVKNLKNNKEYRHTIGYSGGEIKAARAAKPQFSYDSTHVIFLISPSKAEVEKANKEKKKKDKDKLKKKLGIMDLSDGKVTVFERVKSFEMPKETSGWVAYLKEGPPEEEKKNEEKKIEEEKEEEEKRKKREYGTPLVLLSLQDGKETMFDSVTEYRFTKNGKCLLYFVSSKENPKTDGLYCHLVEDSSTKALLTGKGKYTKWAMDKEETRLAFLSDRDDQEAVHPTFSLYGWKSGESEASLWVSHKSTPNFPDGMAVSDKSDVTFNEDGQVVMFGIKEIPEPKKEEQKKTDEEKAKFNLWHWNDPYPQPHQKKMAKKMRDNTWESVYDLKNKLFVKLADEGIPDVQLSPSGKVAFAQTILPYTKLVSYDGSYFDIYIIDPKSGKRTLAKRKLYSSYSGGAKLSPNGKYISWFENGGWFIYDITKKSTTNITVSLDVSFEREDWDTPNPPASYGMAGWTDYDESILVYDRYDIWQINSDGSEAHMITEGFGRKNNLSFRYVKLDPEEKTIDPKKPILLKTRNEETMAEGFFRDQIKGRKLPVKLIMADKRFTFRRRDLAVKAKNVNKLLFTRSSFDEYPDLWISDLDFKNPRKITNLGRQLKPFLWGRAELRSFLSSDGKLLKGILIKPENFDPNKKYPLMVYIYETLHQGLHIFYHPSPGITINCPYYVSNGYVIWMPDIEYGTGYPGRDALKCVLPGIQMLIQEGFINPKAIGIQGHSWGGYQIAYMITQTNIFAAAEAGAPVSNMISAYGGIRWSSGRVRQFQYERTQSRLGGSLWQVPMRYIENSPVFWADKVQTPILMMHNDEDGAVPWYQGIEYIMALSRLGKKAYMFNYNAEGHGLRKRVNKKDWTKRMAEFFDHHLKGASAPTWMTEGIKAWDKEEEK